MLRCGRDSLGLSVDARVCGESSLAMLIGTYGYSRASARDLVGALASLRYRGA